MNYSFFFDIEPVPKSSVRVYKNGGTGFSKKTEKFMKDLKFKAKCKWVRDPIKKKPLEVEIEFALTRPKSIPKSRKHPFVKPDLDNLEKSLFDCLEGVVYDNDSRIVIKNSKKIYAKDHGYIKVNIRVLNE